MTNVGFRSLRVRVATYNKLDRLARGKESYSDVIDRIIKQNQGNP